MSQFDDNAPLDGIQLPDKPVCLPLDSESRRRVAHAYRLIRHKYSQGQGQSFCPADVLHRVQSYWPGPATSECLKLVTGSQTQTPESMYCVNHRAGASVPEQAVARGDCKAEAAGGRDRCLVRRLAEPCQRPAAAVQGACPVSSDKASYAWPKLVGESGRGLVSCGTLMCTACQSKPRRSCPRLDL